jgi:hypothetical protein
MLVVGTGSAGAVDGAVDGVDSGVVVEVVGGAVLGAGSVTSTWIGVADWTRIPLSLPHAAATTESATSPEIVAVRRRTLGILGAP